MKPLMTTNGITVGTEWKRILRPGGFLAFEASISSVKYVRLPLSDNELIRSDGVTVENATYEFFNPSHLTVSVEAGFSDAVGSKTRLSRVAALSAVGSRTMIGVRQVIPAPGFEQHPEKRVEDKFKPLLRRMTFTAFHEVLGWGSGEVLCNSKRRRDNEGDCCSVIYDNHNQNVNSADAAQPLEFVGIDCYPIAVRGDIPEWFCYYKL